MVLYFPRRIVYAKRKNTELQINLYTSYKSTAFQIHCKIKYRELRTIYIVISTSLVSGTTAEFLQSNTISLCMECKHSNVYRLIDYL